MDLGYIAPLALVGLFLGIALMLAGGMHAALGLSTPGEVLAVELGGLALFCSSFGYLLFGGE